MSTKIYSLWISGSLQPVNHLTIRSALAWKHRVIIYSYSELPELSGITGCEVRDAREVLPDSEIFYYQKMEEAFSFGGIAERLKAELLYQFGGWHVDLDVTFLNSFETLKEEYVLRPHAKGVVGNIIKAPAKSTLTEYYRAWTQTITADNEDFEKSFEGLNTAVVFLGLKNFIVKPELFGLDENKYYMPLLQDGGMNPKVNRKAIHWCSAMRHHLVYEPGSYYEGLLKHYGII